MITVQPWAWIPDRLLMYARFDQPVASGEFVWLGSSGVEGISLSTLPGPDWPRWAYVQIDPKDRTAVEDYWYLNVGRRRGI